MSAGNSAGVAMWQQLWHRCGGRGLMAVTLVCGLSLSVASAQSPTPLKVGKFQVDVTPPLGSPVAYATVRKIDDPLFAKGVVLVGSGQPIVICAVDWIGIGNGGHDVWRQKIADAAGTDPSRVAVHALHQHDGPRCDFSAEELLEERGLGNKQFDVAFTRQCIENVTAAVKQAVQSAEPVSHVGVGVAKVEKVASNRRIIGPDGKLKLFRMSSYKIKPEILARLQDRASETGYVLSPLDPASTIAAPEGVIDPLLRLISFWSGDKPIVAVSYYTTHPQSYFGDGDVTSEFVGIARDQRQAELGFTQVHFNGASGNVAAGKYNDGTHETRIVLTKRMHDGMQRAWDATKKFPITASDVEWRVQPVKVPLGDHMKREEWLAKLNDTEATASSRIAAARKVSFLDRIENGHEIELTCLRIGHVYILHMPGELFVEYQLAAQQMRPGDVVCMAAYGDYGTGYIGTAISYEEGGYETGPGASNVAPAVEKVLMDGMRALLLPEQK